MSSAGLNGTPDVKAIGRLEARPRGIAFVLGELNREGLKNGKATESMNVAVPPSEG
jgi:hypothetical protein